MDTERLPWNLLKKVFIWITRKCFDWWTSTICLQRFEDRIPTNSLWRKHRNTGQSEMFWIVPFMAKPPSENSEQISPTWDSGVNGSIVLLCEIWLQLRFFPLVFQTIWACSLFISPFPDWNNVVKNKNYDEHFFILINDFITHIHTFNLSSVKWDVYNQCHENETALTIHQQNPSLVIWKTRLIFLCVNLYMMLRKP